MTEVTLYDLASRAPQKSWSPNPWKIRLALNYKGIAYKTEWLEYPDIAPTLKALGVKPNPAGTPYTVPAVKLPSAAGGDQVLQDSWPIAQELERAYPDTPSLHLDSPYVGKVRDLVAGLITTLYPTFVAVTPRKLLNPASLDYYAQSRQQSLGVAIDTYEEREGGQKAWTKATPTLAALVTLLQEHPEGPFFAGSQVTYADFILVALLRFLETLGSLWHALDAFEASQTGGRKAAEDLYFASAQWLKRDDH